MSVRSAAKRKRRAVQDGSPAIRGGRLFLWPGRGMYLGPLLGNRVHAHHALQLSVALGHALRLQTHPTGPWRAYSAVLSGADQSHRIACEGIVAQMYFDPESAEGRRLAKRLGSKGLRPIRQDACAAIRQQLRVCWKDEWDGERCRRVVDEATTLLAPPGSPRRLDGRVARVLDLIHAAPHRLPPRSVLAAQVSLSPSRLAHLFRSHTGLAIRRYALWVRLHDALQRMAAGAALTAVAHSVEFSDLAHLTRTFQRMFGMPPSALREVTTIAILRDLPFGSCCAGAAGATPGLRQAPTTFKNQS